LNNNAERLPIHTRGIGHFTADSQQCTESLTNHNTKTAGQISM